MRIILASNSPRRKELLSNIGVKFEVVAADIDEKVLPGESPEAVVMALAFEKALAVAEQLGDEQAVVIGADTVVVRDGEILGKPTDEADAYNMLSSIAGRDHEVFTGFAVVRLSDQKKIISFEKTEVDIRELDEASILRYINTGEPADKAGAYAIQGYGSLIVSAIKGDYFNVVGLPLFKLASVLDNDFGYKII